MSSRVSRAHPATVEDADARGLPVPGTKHVATSVAGRPTHSRIDARSDSGYSSRTYGTLASADSAKALPQVPEPPLPEKVDITPPPVTLAPPPSDPVGETARPSSPVKKHVRTSSKASKPSRTSRSSRSHPKPERCRDPTCTLDHSPYPPNAPIYNIPPEYRYPPPADPYDPRHAYWHEPRALPSYEYPPSSDRTLRRSSRSRRPSTYHEDMSPNLGWLSHRLGDLHRGSDPEESRRLTYDYHPADLPPPGSRDPYSLRGSYFDQAPERPPLRHAITDERHAWPAHVDPHDPYHERLSGHLLEHGPVDIPARRRSVHGQPYTSSRASHSPSRYNRALVPHPRDSADYYSMPPPPGSLPAHYDQYQPWSNSYLEPGHEVRHRDEHYHHPGRSAHSRTRSAAHVDHGGPGWTSRRSSFASQDRRLSHTGDHHRRRKSSTRRSISPEHAQALRDLRPGRRASHSMQYEQERRERRDSSRDYSPVEDKASEALKYQDQVRGGPMDDDLATTMRHTYGSTTKRPGLIGPKQPSVTSRTSSKSRQSHNRPSDMHSRSSRRNSDYHVRVQVINDGEEIQSYRLPIRGDKPLHFTVDEDGGVSSQVRVDRPPSTSSRWSWLTGSGKSGRSRAASDQDVVDDRRGRRKMDIKSPIIEGSREDHWGGSRR